MKRTDKNLNILVISFDWRNIFENDFDELVGKLKRDRLYIEDNNFFLFNWADKSYHEKKENIETAHVKYFLTRNRMMCDLLSLFLLPFVLWKYKFKPDIIWIKEFPFVFSAIIPKLLWKSKIVFLLSATPKSLVRTRRFGNLKYMYQVICEYLAKYFIDHSWANGEATKKYLIDVGFRGEEIMVFPGNAILRDVEYINNSKKGRVREKYNISDNKKIILSVGRMEREKGYDRLLKLFKDINRDDFILIIVGDGVLKEEIKKQISDLGLEKKVIMAGWVSRKDIWDYYRDADIFTLLSYSDGCPTVVREAMYMEVPVIGSDIESIRAFLGENEERGLLYKDKETAENFNSKIQRCLEEGGERVKKAKEYIDKEIGDMRPINSYL